MKTQIVVVGGGAGGLELVRRLGAKLRPRRIRHHPGRAQPHPYLEAAAARGRGRLAGRQSGRSRLSQPRPSLGLPLLLSAPWKASTATARADRASRRSSTRTARDRSAAIASATTIWSSPSDRCRTISARRASARTLPLPRRPARRPTVSAIKLLNHCLRVSRTLCRRSGGGRLRATSPSSAAARPASSWPPSSTTPRRR